MTHLAQTVRDSVCFGVVAQVDADDGLHQPAAHLPARHTDDEIPEIHSLDDVLVVGAELASGHPVDSVLHHNLPQAEDLDGVSKQLLEEHQALPLPQEGVLLMGVVVRVVDTDLSKAEKWISKKILK